jgi:L-malate glycosyltransferase
MRPRILIIDNSSGVTGAFNSIFNYTQILAHQYEFHFCLPNNSLAIEILKNKEVPYIALPFIELSKSWRAFFYFPALFSNTWRLRVYCKKNNIRIVHVNDLYNMTGVLLKTLLPIKIIYHIRLLPTSYIGKAYKWWIKIISTQADVLLAVSNATIKSASEFTEKHIYLLYDTIGITLPIVPLLERHDDRVEFLYPANFTLGKGQQYAIMAMEKVVATYTKVHLTFVGGTFDKKANKEFKDQLQHEIDQRNLRNYITLGAFEKDLLSRITRSDIVLNFSESESFSMVCLEALSCERALIATDSGGPSELFENNLSGILVPNRDIIKMADAMILLAHDSTLRKGMGQAGRRFVSEKFDPQLQASNLNEYYAGLL